VFTARYELIPYIKQIKFCLLKVNSAPSSSSYFVILIRFPVLLSFQFKKIHNLSRIMEQILIRIFVKPGLNMSSMDKAVKSKGLVCYGCLPTQSMRFM
jgi:hypothetical protein